ncbi:MAG: ABC transporter ATP-binding protein, partial [Solirubrobacterales bacterium]|nr:ABC transporter ATP-binding protein [Solirubrobacterales bacterium]
MLIFRRLLGFLRPYRRSVAWSFALAFGAMGTTVLIPYLTGRAIDSVSNGHRDQLVVWAVAIVLAGLARLALSASRRLVAGKVSLAVEVDLRDRLYGALQ